MSIKTQTTTGDVLAAQETVQNQQMITAQQQQNCGPLQIAALRRLLGLSTGRSESEIFLKFLAVPRPVR